MSAQPDPARPFGPASWLAFGAAAAVLIWGALSYLPGQIDDAYIVYAYAHRVVELGEVAWNTGERVEGYSSPLHLFVMVLGCFAGFDLAVFGRAFSFVAALATLGLLLRPRLGEGRTAIALIAAAWQPFQHWSVMGLDTALATMMGVAGWPLVFGGRGAWAAGCGLMAAYSLTRPEGAAWLVAALALRIRLPRGFGRPEVAVLGVLAALAAYHVARVAYFGALLPTPWLVKIVAVEAFAAGARQLSWEVLSAAPLFLTALALRRRVPIWVWFPAVLQGALLVRAGGDWMGHGRMVAPGVIASVAAALFAGTPRTMPRAGWLGVVAAAGWCFAWEPSQMQAAGPRLRDSWFLVRPMEAVRTPWSVPLLEDVAFLIPRVPVGAGVQMSDVGLPGNLDDIRIWDGAGLTDRVVAEIIAGQHDGIPPALQARFDDPDDLWCMRYGLTPEGADPADAWLKGLFPDVASEPDRRGMIWRCRTGGAVSASVAVDRWRRLLARFPSQDEVRLLTARALLDAGHEGEAVMVARGATWVHADADGWLAFVSGADGPYQPGRGWPMYDNGAARSAELPEDFWRSHVALLDVDAPGTAGAEVSLSWEPPCGESAGVTIRGLSEVSLQPCSGSRRLVVEFVNDAWTADGDKNIYVTLRATENEA